ncbi:MAG: hypothetical protein QW400_01975 [Candidatus Diapherotrites archaeon]
MEETSSLQEKRKAKPRVDLTLEEWIKEELEEEMADCCVGEAS